MTGPPHQGAVGQVIRGGFLPPHWLRNPHVQTLLANKPLRWPQGPAVEDLRLELPDGDIVRLVRSTAASAAQQRPVVVVLHGLAGGYDSAYARDLFQTLHRAGMEAHMLHFRGCGGVSNRLPRGYHAGDTEDLRYYLAKLRQSSAGRPIAAVGFSLGANVLLKHLGESGSASGLDAAAAVSVPFDLQDACESISRGFSVLYHKVLLSRLKRSMIERFATQGDAPFDLASLQAVQTLRAFDELVTAPIHGFRSADHYYRVSSCRQFLRGVQTPTLIVHAQDDPFQSIRGIPARHELAPAITLELPEYGGHVGFLDWGPAGGTAPDKPPAARPPAAMPGAGLRSWLAPRITDWLQQALAPSSGGGHPRPPSS